MSVKFMTDGSLVIDGEESVALREYVEACRAYDRAFAEAAAANDALQAAEEAADKANGQFDVAEKARDNARNKLQGCPALKGE